MTSQTTGPAMHKPIGPFAALATVSLALLVWGCGAGATKSGSVTVTESARRSSGLAWEPGTTPPKVTAGLIAQAGYGLTAANANLGTVDEVIGSVSADTHVDPSTKPLDDEYARFGRCMAEQLKIHDVGHELALLVAYNRKDHTVQAAVEKESAVCEGFAITPDANYQQSLATNP
jgi:hypothetical protein